jgi:uncharacterized membrane protein
MVGEKPLVAERSGFARLRTYFLTGLVIVAPLTITITIVWSLIGWVDGWIKPYLPTGINPDDYLPFAVPGFGLVVGLFGITMIGFLTANFVGGAIVRFGERIVARMPVVRNIYGGLKQIFETMFSDTAHSFKRVALVEFPHKGIWSLAFVAGDSTGEIREVLTPRSGETVAVVMTTTLNPTTGFLMYFPKSEVIFLEMSVEECAKLILSAGLVQPETRQEKIRAIAAKEGVKLPERP